ncbi:MAG: glycosyltransferase, partial [Geminicoccaceae bacterium]
MQRHDVIIANGFDRYHLLIAAAEAERRGRLDRCIAGFYPTAGICSRLSMLGLLKRPRIARLLDRKVELSDERLATMPLWETVGHVGGRLFGERVIQAARLGFSKKAETVIRRSQARLYHYRSGYGHSSAARAKRRGMATVCDHSIAHPAVLAHLVDNQGRLPPIGERGRITPLWADIMDDLQHADRVLVNSDFVKETFVHQGWEPERIEVVYQGLDDAFFALLPARQAAADRRENAPLRLAFAGAFEQRKGA